MQAKSARKINDATGEVAIDGLDDSHYLGALDGNREYLKDTMSSLVKRRQSDVNPTPDVNVFDAGDLNYNK